MTTFYLSSRFMRRFTAMGLLVAGLLLGLSGCAGIKTQQASRYHASLDIKEPGLAAAKVVDGENKTVKVIFSNKALAEGPVDVSWDGTDSEGKVVMAGSYRFIVTVNRWELGDLNSFGGLGASSGRFLQPKGLSAAYQGARLTVAVADTGNNRIQLFTDSGSFLQEIGSFGLGDNRLNQPTDVDWDGQILTVCDSQNRRLVRFDATGAFLGQVNQLSGFPTSSSNPIHLDFQNPSNLQREGGSFWVSDPGYGLVELLTNTGGLVQQMGQTFSLGNDGPFLKWPSGDLWYQTGKDRVARMDANGSDLSDLKPTPGFKSVGSMALSSKGFAVVGDPAQGLLYFFDQDGKCFQAVSPRGCGQPGGLCILEDHLFVVDQDQTKVHHYQLLPHEQDYRQGLKVQGASTDPAP